jgi:hypothetical protein
MSTAATQLETDTSLANRTPRTALSPTAKGALFGPAAAAIWGLVQASARAGVQAGLTPFDVAAMRFGIAGLLLLP